MRFSLQVLDETDGSRSVRRAGETDGEVRGVGYQGAWWADGNVWCVVSLGSRRLEESQESLVVWCVCVCVCVR